MRQAMPISSNKVNVSEKDIEDYLYGDPQAIRFAHLYVSHWTGRQVTVPSGIIDLIGVVSNGKNAMGPAVVEIKNVDVDVHALAQVSRYARDIEIMLILARVFAPVYKIIVAPHISDQRFCEAAALDISVVTFETTMSANFSNVEWTSDYVTRRQEQYNTISQKLPVASLIELFSGDADDQENQETEVSSDDMGEA